MIDELEGEAARVQDELAAHHTSLLLIRNLVRAGIPLTKVRTLSVEELAKYTNARTGGGKPMDPAKVRRMCQDVHGTFARLGDLRALADGKPSEFAKFLAANYYFPRGCGGTGPRPDVRARRVN